MEVCHYICCRFSWFLHAKKGMMQIILQITFVLNIYPHGEDKCRIYQNFHSL